MSDLPKFEGRDVRKATLRLTNAGDGLSEALSIDPKAYHHGDEIFLVLKAKITQVNHKPEREDDDDLVRVHTAKAEEVAEVAAQDIATYLADAKERARIARDAAAGQDQLPIEGAEPPGKKARMHVEKDGPAGLGKEAEFDPAQLPAGAPA